MYLTLEWDGELLYLPVIDIHPSGMLVVAGDEGERYLCIPARDADMHIARYGLTYLKDEPLMVRQPDPWRDVEAQKFLSACDGRDGMMPVKIIVTK
jgi:hypothetical protein